MKTKDAINHFKWKFTQSNTNVSKRDKQALNSIIIALNKQESYILNDNINLCKLLMYTFKKMVLTNAIHNNYKEVNIHLIHNRLRDIFLMDASAHLDSVTNEIQQIEMQGLIDNNNLNTKTMLNLTNKDDIKKATRGMISEFIYNNCL